MGWSHPDISLDDLLKLIRGFVDILILACGYQSSGECAVWDAENVKRAVEWGLFFEEVFRRLRDLNMYEESVKELDEALLELTSNPHFPQGIKHISSSTLTRARSFILEHFIQTLPLNDGHLKAILTTIIEMDIDDLARKEHDVSSYFDKLMVQITSLNLMPSERGLVKGSTSSTWRAGCFSGDQAEPVPCGYPGLRDPHRNSKRDNKEDNGENHSKFIIIELLKRQTGVACISLLGMGLDILSEIATRNNSLGSETLSSEESSSTDIDVMYQEKLSRLVLLRRWRSKSLSYFLGQRTIRMVSGADLIFNAPKVQWIQVLETLKVSGEVIHDNSTHSSFLEIVELLLVGFAASRWNHLIEHFVSFSCDLLPISKQYYDLHNLLQARPQFQRKGTSLNYKEKDILEYLLDLTATQTYILWKLPPVLAAISIPSWSPLFRTYLIEIDKQIKGDSSMIRFCTCSQHGVDYQECEVAERIWCLYIFHIKGSHLMVDNFVDSEIQSYHTTSPMHDNVGSGKHY